MVDILVSTCTNINVFQKLQQRHLLGEMDTWIKSNNDYTKAKQWILPHLRKCPLRQQN